MLKCYNDDIHLCWLAILPNDDGEGTEAKQPMSPSPVFPSRPCRKVEDPGDVVTQETPATFDILYYVHQHMPCLYFERVFFFLNLIHMAIRGQRREACRLSPGLHRSNQQQLQGDMKKGV